VSIILLGEGEVVMPRFPPTHVDEEMIILNDADDLMEDPLMWLINILMISYMLGDVDGMWFVSFFIKIPFTTLKVVLKQKGLSCHFHRTGLHAYMIHMFGILRMM
jgi:hypothetical protein